MSKPQVRVRLLGSVEAAQDGASVPVRGARRQAVLALLALHRGTVISVDRLVDVVWDGHGPATAGNTLQSHVSHLRHLLGDAGAIVWRAPGYVLNLDAGAVDVEAAETLIQRAAAAAPAEAQGDLAAALALWRGEPLADLAGVAGLADEVARLDGLWLRAKLAWIDASLTLGEHAQLVRELAGLAREHPFDERVHAQLVLALYRCGRQADALTALHGVRRRLADELGVDLGPALRDLEVAILQQDPALFDIPGTPPAAPAPPTPAQLPHAVGPFVGRERELSALDTLLPSLSEAPPGIAVVSGTAGVGKTALVVHWAHRMAGHFPDGQLYVNLRGFDPSEPPVPATRVLHGFLTALGVPATRMPTDADGQATAYRSLLAGKRVLVVLDNARDAEQVRPMLPGSPGCPVVITSRDGLTPLVATEGAHPVLVAHLSGPEARELLGRRLDPRRLADEPVAVAEIVRRCGGLPLALVIVAAKAAGAPQHPLAAAARELRGATGPLDALRGGDAATDIRAVFEWSYRTLSDDTATMFRVLGVHPGPDIGVAVAASGAGVPVERARSMMDELVRANLVTEHVTGRFVLHDLLRAYAIERARDSGRRHATLKRMLDHYLRTAYDAAQLLEPGRAGVTAPPRLVPPSVSDGITTPAVSDRITTPAVSDRITTPAVSDRITTPAVFDRITTLDEALAWFTTEHRVLLSAVTAAAAAGFDVHAWHLTWTLAPYLHPRGHWPDQVACGRTALAAAERLGDRLAEAHACRGLAAAYAQLGRVDDARSFYQRALEAATLGGDHRTAARTELGLAWLWERDSAPRNGLPHTRRAMLLYEMLGDKAGEARALNAAGWLYALLGEYGLSLHHSDQALAMLSDAGDREGQALTLDTLGYAYSHLGAHPQAIECYERAAVIINRLADPYTESEILTSLGDAHAAAGDQDAARVTWRRALSIVSTFEHPDAQRLRERLGLDPVPLG